MLAQYILLRSTDIPQQINSIGVVKGHALKSQDLQLLSMRRADRKGEFENAASCEP